MQNTPNMTNDELKTKAAILKALAHPVRLKIVEELGRHKQRCVCELTALVGLDMSTVSKHLSVMKQVGLVRDRKVGQQVYYSLTTPCVLRFLNCLVDVQNGQSCPE